MFERREQTVEPMLVTSRQAARMLSISERTLWARTQAKEIRVVRIGRCVRYSVDDLREYIRRASEKNL